MKIQISKQAKQTGIGGFCLAVGISLGVSLLIHKLGALIRSLGGLLGLGEDAEIFAGIFDQLQEAKVDLPACLVLIMCMLMFFGVIRYFKFIGRKKTEKKALYAVGIFGGIVWIVPAVLLIGTVTLWFTDVNEVRFGTVIQFLYSALQHGVF